ncbi:MAG: hypothetical protein ACTSQ1_05505 [Promethearchaeota archaeon]
MKPGRVEDPVDFDDRVGFLKLHSVDLEIDIFNEEPYNCIHDYEGGT